MQSLKIMTLSIGLVYTFITDAFASVESEFEATPLRVSHSSIFSSGVVLSFVENYSAYQFFKMCITFFLPRTAGQENVSISKHSQVFPLLLPHGSSDKIKSDTEIDLSCTTPPVRNLGSADLVKLEQEVELKETYTEDSNYGQYVFLTNSPVVSPENSPIPLQQNRKRFLAEVSFDSKKIRH